MLERETGLGDEVGGEPARTGVNGGSEIGHLRLLSSTSEALEVTGGCTPCSNVAREQAGQGADDPVMERLVQAGKAWSQERNPRELRKALLAIMGLLDE